MNARVGYEPYQPQLELVTQGKNIWTVEGPETQYRLAGAIIPCPTRMTVVQCVDGSLWLHSPVIYSTDLQKSIDALGTVSAIVSPNSYHYLHVGNWVRANAKAIVFAPVDVAHKIATTSSTLCQTLTADWQTDLDHFCVELSGFSETVFFHRASQSLIVTDLMQTFEGNRVRSALARLLLKFGGATGPNGKPSIEIRLASLKHRAELRAGIRQMIAWKPRQIILSHGVCVRDNPMGFIESAFNWL